MDFLRFMLFPILACLLLAGIHGYLGIHVLSRGVIFVDLAMAQVAALGASMSLLFHFELESPMAYAFSIGFTFIGALAISVVDFRNRKISQEAIIGVVYVIAAAAVILVMDHAPHGGEHVKDLMVGHILWVSKIEVLIEAVVYWALGLAFALCSSRIHLITQDTKAAKAKGLNIVLWDMVFYVLFGIVVTVSVRLAGVLLVFSFLVVPAIISFMFQDRFWPRILTAWVVSSAVSILGCVISFKADWPTGATVVVTFGAALVIAGLVFIMRKSLNRIG